MSDLVQKGEVIVRQAERSLRDLMQDGINRGDYKPVRLLASWAEGMSQLGRSEVSDRREIVDDVGLATKGRGRSGAAKRKAKGTRSKPDMKYPMFRRSGNKLVKIAWSKASKSEYEHQAPKDVAIALLHKMHGLSGVDGLVAMEQVLPIKCDTEQNEAPAYQVYVCLAWLRSVGAVKQHGRRGYSVSVEREPRYHVEKAWGALPSHNS